MASAGDLKIAAGIASETGKRPDNQDFAAVYEGTPLERVNHGIIAAVADGVGGSKGGRVASELAIRSLIDGYYAQPDTIGPANAASRALKRRAASFQSVETPSLARSTVSSPGYPQGSMRWKGFRSMATLSATP